MLTLSSMENLPVECNRQEQRQSSRKLNVLNHTVGADALVLLWHILTISNVAQSLDFFNDSFNCCECFVLLIRSYLTTFDCSSIRM